MERPNVCIIDSGIGGISILDEIDKLIPGMEYTCTNKEFFPYGHCLSRANSKSSRYSKRA